MTTNYPSGYDALTNPAPGDSQAALSHAAQHANANDAIEAIEAELGLDPAGSLATVRARLDALVKSLPAQPMGRAAAYYMCNSPGSYSDASNHDNEALRVGAWLVPAPVTIARLWMYVASAGDASSVFRMGVYADDNGYPGALLLDAGTVSCASTGTQEITVSLTLTPGRYWVGGVLQSTTTQPTLRCMGEADIGPYWVSGAPASGEVLGWVATSVSGALPDPYPTGSSASRVVRMGVRTA